jgi:hypothetical protein
MTENRSMSKRPEAQPSETRITRLLHVVGSPAFGDPFVAALQERAALETIDIGCCTDAGGFVVANHHGDGAIEHSRPELALAFFFLRLLQELQQIGTVPAMDYSAYLEGMGV